MDISKHLRRYIEQTNEIRDLSSPIIGQMNRADVYRDRLIENFIRIGELAKDNQKILEECFYPFLTSDDLLDQSNREDLKEFSEAIVDAYNLTNLDAPIVYFQARRMLEQAEASGDEETLILALDEMVSAAYLMICITARLMPIDNICKEYRDEGLRASERLLEYLDREKFCSLSEELKELIVINARYIRVVSEIDDVPLSKEDRDVLLERMKAAMAMVDDPFYREQLPSYDWELHRFRTYEYICSLTDFCNRMGFEGDQLTYINDRTREMVEQYEANLDQYSKYHRTKTVYLYSIRNAYLVGEIDLEEYKRQLISMMYRDLRQSTLEDVPVAMLMVPMEFMIVLDNDNMSPEEEGALNYFYNRLIGYLYQTPKKDALTFLLTLLSVILRNYVELKSGMDFETMGLSLVTAIHPITYVHTLCVAEIAKCLTGHLLREDPGLFTDMPEYENETDVSEHIAEIEDYAYHASLCHDFGKLMIADTILTYGRNLTDEEFGLVRDHPSVGAYLLGKYKSTSEYADVAMGHHKWFNDQGGYPDEFKMSESPYRTIVAIVACADCLDAATDYVGRSYKKGKTLDEFLQELKEGSGTRYAPYLSDLLDKPEVKSEIETILSKEREENYRKAYLLLKKKTEDQLRS